MLVPTRRAFLPRRAFLRRAGLRAAGLGAFACPLCTAGLARAAEWSYGAPTGPGSWGELAADYGACSAGRHQSPIDLTGALEVEFDPASLDWSPFDGAAVENNGHTIEVKAPGGNALTFDGTAHTLLQFHFHEQSEHTIDGVHFPMEAHFVHQAEDGNLAVLGVLLKDGETNPEIAKVWAAMPSGVGEAESEETIDPRGLLPASTSSYLYSGSLTTPPCSEIVTWIVMAEPATSAPSRWRPSRASTAAISARCSR